MSERVRLVCPLRRKHAELWGGITLLVAAVVLIALDPSALGHQLGAVPLALLGGALIWHSLRYTRPVLEADTNEFRYTRGRYIVRIPFSEVGSYYVVNGRIRALGLCDSSGRPRVFPSVEGRRARRPYLPLTGSVSPRKIDEFMSTAGIPPRDRSLLAGPTKRRR